MKKNVIVGLVLVTLILCIWSVCEEKRDERVKTMLSDYVSDKNGDGNYEVEVLSISDGKVEYTYVDNYFYVFESVSMDYLENNYRNSYCYSF